MSLTWQESLTNIKKEILAAQVPLRFNLPWVPVSSIAEQFYCEAKVDYEYKFGRVPTPEKEEGTALHDEIITMEPTTPENLVRSIKKKPSCLCTFPVYGKVEDLAIMGIPDAVLFQKSRPSHVVELKSTGGDVSRLWRDQVVQVKSYALALELMGFDCNNLRLSLVRVNKNEITDEVKELLLNEIAKAFMRGTITETEKTLKEELKTQLRIHVLNYDKQDALKDLLWAKDYWLMKREAIPTRNPSKCRSCEFNEKCPYSLVKELGAR